MESNHAAQILKKVIRTFEPILISDPVRHPDTGPTQELLDAAHVAVYNMLFTILMARAIDRELHEKELRGRLSESDRDILRAMIAYAGAGLHAALKQLIADTVQELIGHHNECKEKFVRFNGTNTRSAIRRSCGFSAY